MRRLSAPLLLVTLAASPVAALGDEPAPTPAPTDAAAPPAAAPAPKLDASAPIPSSDQRPLYALGARVHGLFVPGFLLGSFLQVSPGGLNSYLIGGEFTYRKGNLDVVTAIDFAAYGLPSGNYLAVNKDAPVDTHYVEFHGLNFVALDVSLVWHKDLASWIEIMLGGGLGIGAVLGDVYLINGSPNCNLSNAGNSDQCYPISNGMAIKPSDPNFQAKLDQTARDQAACQAGGGADCRDTALHPYWHVSGDKPPVMVMINFILGFRFKLHRHFNFNLSGGFRNGFVIGGGPEVVF